MKLENIISKGKDGLLTLLASATIAGCNLNLKYAIDSIAKADFDNDGIEDVVGYTMDPDLPTSPGTTVLAIINGRNIEKHPVHGQNLTLYTPREKIRVIQPHAKFYDESNIENVSVQDVNGDGLPDLSYDMKIGTKKHKVCLNQGDGTLKGEI